MMSIYSLILIISVIISSISQILLKKSATIVRENKIREYVNIFVISAYALLFISTFLTLIAYKKVQLSQGMVLEAVSYILIPIFSCFVFKEKITKRKIIGICTIIIGIIIFSSLG